MDVEIIKEKQPLTPAIMAQAFWNMDDNMQADFFEELAIVIEEDHKNNPSSYSLGEMQWLFMTEKIRKRGEKARAMYLAFCAFAYEYATPKAKL